MEKTHLPQIIYFPEQEPIQVNILCEALCLYGEVLTTQPIVDQSVKG